MLTQVGKELSGLSVMQSLGAQLVKQSSTRSFGTNDDEKLVFRGQATFKAYFK